MSWISRSTSASRRLAPSMRSSARAVASRDARQRFERGLGGAVGFRHRGLGGGQRVGGDAAVVLGMARSRRSARCASRRTPPARSPARCARRSPRRCGTRRSRSARRRWSCGPATRCARPGSPARGGRQARPRAPAPAPRRAPARRCGDGPRCRCGRRRASSRSRGSAAVRRARRPRPDARPRPRCGRWRGGYRPRTAPTCARRGG